MGSLLGLWTAVWLLLSHLVVTEKWFLGADYRSSSIEVNAVRDFLLRHGVPSPLTSAPVLLTAILLLCIGIAVAFELSCYWLHIDRQRAAPRALRWAFRSIRQPRWLAVFAVVLIWSAVRFGFGVLESPFSQAWASAALRTSAGLVGFAFCALVILQPATFEPPLRARLSWPSWPGWRPVAVVSGLYAVALLLWFICQVQNQALRLGVLALVGQTLYFLGVVVLVRRLGLSNLRALGILRFFRGYLGPAFHSVLILASMFAWLVGPLLAYWYLQKLGFDRAAMWYAGQENVPRLVGLSNWTARYNLLLIPGFLSLFPKLMEWMTLFVAGRLASDYDIEKIETSS